MGQLATGRFRPLTFTRHRLSPLAVFTSGDPSSLISLVVSVDVKHCTYLLLVCTFFTMAGRDSKFARFTVPPLKGIFEGL